MADIVDLDPYSIGSPAPGVNLSVVPNASMRVMEAVINATWNLALDKSEAVGVKTANITSGSGMFSPSAAPSVAASEVLASAATVGAVTAGTVAAPDAVSVDSFSAGSFSYPSASSDVVTAGSVSAPTVTASPVTASAVSAGAVTVPNIVAPAVNIPADIAVGDLWAEWETRYLEIAAWLVEKYTAWIAAYAPNNQALYTAAESSLLAALQNDSYIPASTQAQIFGDDAARILSDKMRAQDAVIAQFASRRFPLPPDAAASAVLQIEQKAQDAMAESSRKIAIMSVEQYRFVIQHALSARDMVLKAANDYIRSLASAPDTASKVLGLGYDVQTKLISAAAAFYNADANAKDVMAKVSEFNVNSALEASKTTSSLSLEASKTTSSLALEASKTTSSLSLEASKTTSSLALEASKTTSSLAFEASKTNTHAAIDAGKANTSLALEADKAMTEFLLEARKANAGFAAEANKVSAQLAFDANKTSASLGLDASKFNASMSKDVSKDNAMLALEADSKNQAAKLTVIDYNLRALLGEITSVTQQAVAALNNLHLTVSMTAGGTTVTTQVQNLD